MTGFKKLKQKEYTVEPPQLSSWTSGCNSGYVSVYIDFLFRVCRPSPGTPILHVPPCMQSMVTSVHKL